jgi:hypothetical protein
MTKDGSVVSNVSGWGFERIVGKQEVEVRQGAAPPIFLLARDTL